MYTHCYYYESSAKEAANLIWKITKVLRVGIWKSVYHLRFSAPSFELSLLATNLRHPWGLWSDMRQGYRHELPKMVATSHNEKLKYVY